jgi:hypothetical protein
MIASIFGTKARLASWIWVAAWNILTVRPTTMAAPSKGAEIRSVVFKQSRNI